MSICADRYLLGIARLSIWLSIMRNLWISWTLIHSSCFILGTNVLLNLSSESKLTHRSCLRWIHSSSSWDHIHAIQFTPHFRGGLDSFFWDRFHQQHLTVKVLEDFLRREELLIWTTFSLTSIPFLDFLVLDVRITLPKKVTGVVAEYAKKHSETRRVSMKYAAVIYCMSNLLYDCQTYCQTYCKNVKSCMIEVRTKAKTMLRTWFQIKVRKNSEKSV